MQESYSSRCCVSCAAALEVCFFYAQGGCVSFRGEGRKEVSSNCPQWKVLSKEMNLVRLLRRRNRNVNTGTCASIDLFWVQIKLFSGERRGAGDLKASLRCRKNFISSCHRRRGPLLEVSLDCWCPRLFLLAVKKCWDVLQSDRSHICDVCHFRRMSCLVYSGVATLQCEVDSLVPGFI